MPKANNKPKNSAKRKTRRRTTRAQTALRARMAIVGFSLLSLLGFVIFLAQPPATKHNKTAPPAKQVRTPIAKPSPALLPEQSKLPPVLAKKPVNAPSETAPPVPPSHESTAPALDKRPKVAIVIDDIGHQWTSAVRLVALEQPVTLAILPFSPYGQRIANLAAASGREVMLHAPMEPNIKSSSWNGGLMSDMADSELSEQLIAMLDWLPHEKGINNHMGSEFTTRRTQMDVIMQTLSERRLYFLDSRTSAQTQALFSAKAHAIPSTKRDVFLDNKRNPDAIAVQFDKLLSIAHKQGFAVGIGHPYPETVAFLERQLPLSPEVAFVPFSQLLLGLPAL